MMRGGINQMNYHLLVIYYYSSWMNNNVEMDRYTLLFRAGGIISPSKTFRAYIFLAGKIHEKSYFFILWVEPKIKHASLVRSRQTIQNLQVFTGFSVQIQEGKQEKIKEGLINSGESFETAGTG